MLSLPRTSRSSLCRTRFAVLLACLLAVCPLSPAFSAGLAPVACNPSDDTDGETDPLTEARPARSVRHIPPPVAVRETATRRPSPIDTHTRARAPIGPAARGPLHLRC